MDLTMNRVKKSCSSELLSLNHNMTASIDTDTKPQLETPFILSEYHNIHDSIVHQHQWLLPNSHYKLIWTKEAGGHHFINDVERPLMTGHIIILAPGQFHKWKNDSHLVGVLCEFSHDILNQHFQKILNKITHIHESKSHYLPTYIPKNKEVMLNQLVKLLLVEFKNSGTLAIIRPLFMTFLHFLEFNESPVHSSLNHSYPLKKLEYLIENNYCHENTVHFYAQQLDMSIKQLNSLVKEVHGKTVSNLIHERIILDAQLSLQTSQCSVKTIAYNLGFEDPSYFSRFFRRYTGLSPNQYRETKIAPSNRG